MIAESRVYNLEKLKDALNCRTCLLRSPVFAKLTMLCATPTFPEQRKGCDRSPSEAAVKQGKVHEVILMVDMGDLREGIWFDHYEEIRDMLKLIDALPGVKLYGLGTNFNCYGTVMPTVKNGNDFRELAKKLEAETGIKIPRLSAGNCTSYHLIDKGIWPGLNHLRIGGLHEYGIEYVDMHYLDQYHHSDKPVGKACSPLYKLKAAIIEL